MYLLLEIDAAHLTPGQIEVLAANVGEVLESARQNGALTAFMDDKTEIDYTNTTFLNSPVNPAYKLV